MADQPTKPTQASLNKKAAQTTSYKPSGVSATGRKARSFAIRLWSVRNARFLEWFYARFADAFLMLHPMWKAVGYERAEAPVKFVEKHVKGFLFDCRMCGQCVLSSTGMSCPMNCPKQLRNGPCGGVRANGNCEVEPDMPCVWVQAWSGANKMKGRTTSSTSRNRSISRCAKPRPGCGSPPTPPPTAKPPQTRELHNEPVRLQSA
jgi:hypothetical protein